MKIFYIFKPILLLITLNKPPIKIRHVNDKKLKEHRVNVVLVARFAEHVYFEDVSHCPLSSRRFNGKVARCKRAGKARKTSQPSKARSKGPRVRRQTIPTNTPSAESAGSILVASRAYCVCALLAIYSRTLVDCVRETSRHGIFGDTCFCDCCTCWNCCFVLF